MYSDKVLSKNGSSELLIPRSSLPVGSYSVRLTVKMTGTKVFGVAEGYIRVINSPIVARIAGGTKTERGFNKTLVFNASLSHDPDAFDSEVRKFNPAFQTHWLLEIRQITHTIVFKIDKEISLAVQVKTRDFNASNLCEVTRCGHLFR